jgi:hypothetical protein
MLKLYGNMDAMEQTGEALRFTNLCQPTGTCVLHACLLHHKGHGFLQSGQKKDEGRAVQRALRASRRRRARFW